MSQIDSEIKAWTAGIHNVLPDTLTPGNSATRSSNWITQDGRLKLIFGRIAKGTHGAAGMITGEIIGYKTNGDTIHWRKAGAKIQYWNGTAWTDVVTGLTVNADYAFTNYSSLAGNFTLAFGIDGIYKMNNAVPGSFMSMYNAAKNFKGHAFTDRGRTILWNRPEDKTGLYGSYIDSQDSAVYTSVTGEATSSLTGTLAALVGHPTRNAFALTITLTGSGEVFTDNLDGTLTGSLGNTGTINYVTGAYTLSVAGTGTAAYQWEDSNIHGITDFTHSATRLAGEGFQFPQDEGGDPILVVLVGQDGAYYSIKKRSAYRLELSDDDLTATNLVYQKNIGVQSFRGACSTQIGIAFINTANLDKPEFTLLQRNVLGNIEPVILFPQFAFSNYLYDDCTIETHERYIVVFCKSAGSEVNDTMLMCNIEGKTVDVVAYRGRTLVRDDDGTYIGDSNSLTTFQIFSGVDDDGIEIDNYWEGNGETFQGKAGSPKLKKWRKLRLRGLIGVDKGYRVYVDYDDTGYQLVGTVLGSGTYVDYGSPTTIGGPEIGQAQIGGDDEVIAYPYFMEIRIKKPPKFYKRKIKFVAFGYGYVDIEYQNSCGLLFYEDKIPTRFRQKQNVSLDGETVDLPNPEY